MIAAIIGAAVVAYQGYATKRAGDKAAREDKKARAQARAMRKRRNGEAVAPASSSPSWLLPAGLCLGVLLLVRR